MAISSVETIDLQNIGIIKGHIDDESLSVLREEVMAIKENFSSGVPHNKELAVHIRKEFLLSKSCKSIEPIVIELATRYNEKYKYPISDFGVPRGAPYKLQLESASVNAEANKDIAENAAMLKQQMQSMTANIASLNAVYGGMLSAMSNKG